MWQARLGVDRDAVEGLQLARLVARSQACVGCVGLSSELHLDAVPSCIWMLSSELHLDAVPVHALAGMFQRNSSRKRRLQAKLAAVEVSLGGSCWGWHPAASCAAYTA